MVVVFQRKVGVLMANINTALPKIARGIVLSAKMKVREIRVNIDVNVKALCTMVNA
jgi:hypothetical protein